MPLQDYSNMYGAAKTWNPFKGCKFDCSYCVPSFKQQSKRQKNLCQGCYTYTPHCHEDRLAKIPSAKIIFVCGNADISFCPPDFARRIIDRIVKHNIRAPYKTYYFQSKRPEYFTQLLGLFPENVILLTTLETNRDAGYAAVAKAPPPSVRYRQFKALKYPRKVVTIEPMLDFDVKTLGNWICSIRPEYVYLGYNSRPKSVALPEPSPEKVMELIGWLRKEGIEILFKKMRGLVI